MRPRKTLPQYVKNRVFDKTDDRCWFCGREIDFSPHCYRSYKNIEHLTPVSRGGTDDLDNLVPACFQCNSRKRTQTLEEFRADFHRFGLSRGEWWWLRFVTHTIGEDEWISHDGEEEMLLHLRRTLARLASRRLIFYGEALAADEPNDYCI